MLKTVRLEPKTSQPYVFANFIIIFWGKIPKLGKLEKRVKKRRLQNHARNDRGEILSRMGAVSYPNTFLGDFSFVFLKNLGLGVKSGWYRRSGLVGRSSAHNLKVQVRFPPPPHGMPVGSLWIPVGSLWDPTSVLLWQRNPPGFISSQTTLQIGKTMTFIITKNADF